MSSKISFRTLILLIIGVLAALGFILGIILDNYPLRMVTKPIPVLMMILFLILNARKGRFPWLIIGGLGLGMVGDILLEYAPETFLLGLIAFLLGHLLYLVAFTLDCRRPAWGIAIFLYLYAIGLYGFLDMGSMKADKMALPVLIYIIVISTMGWRALARYHAPNVHPLSARAGVLGALFFMASDSMLAVDMFIFHLTYAHVAVIITYWLGQLGITLAAYWQNRSHPDTLPQTT